MLQSFLGTIRSAFMSRHIMSRSIRVQKRHGLLSTVQPLEPRVLLTVSPEEQLFVYMLNRARHNPVAYQDENSLPVDLGYVPSRPPLAVNDHLFASAEVHSNDMATNNYAGHYSPFLNKWPNRMVRQGQRAH